MPTEWRVLCVSRNTPGDLVTSSLHFLALQNRLRLKREMERQGFANYRREWWHYDFPAARGRARDVSLGC